MDERVPNAIPGCVRDGCQFSHSFQLLRQAQDALAERERIMQQLAPYEGTLALWCSRGGHAFSELDPGRIIIPPASGRDEDGGEITIPAQAICGEHAAGIGQRRTRPPAAIASPVAAEADMAEREDDHLMLRDLQRQLNEMRASGGGNAVPQG